MKYEWDWSVFFELSPNGVNSYLETIMMGIGWTLMLAISACIFSLLLGSVLGVIRTMRSRALNVLGTLYVEVFRNIPLLVQMFLWYFSLPDLLPTELGSAIKQMPRPWGPFIPALLCLGFYGSARICEQLRAGIQSLPRGQLQAGIAIGLTEMQCYRYIILPEAFRIVIPTLTSEFMGTIKYSSVALTIGLLELTGEARSMQEFSFHIFEAFTAATVGYLIINTAIAQSMRALERRVAVPGLLAAAQKTDTSN